MRIVRVIAISLLGIITSLVLLAVCLRVDDMTVPVIERPNVDPYTHVLNFVWRTRWVYMPIIVFLTSMLISFLDRKRTRIIESIIAILPLVVSNLVASSFSTSSAVSTAFYFAVAALTQLIVPFRKVAPQPTLR